MIKDVTLSYKPDGTLNYRHSPALVFVLNTGLREGELLALSKNRIQQDAEGRKSIHISETVSNVKNRDSRIAKHYIQIDHNRSVIRPMPYHLMKRFYSILNGLKRCLQKNKN